MARGDIIGMNPDGSAIVDDGAGGTLDVAADFAGDAVNRPAPAPAPRMAPAPAPAPAPVVRPRAASSDDIANSEAAAADIAAGASPEEAYRRYRDRSAAYAAAAANEADRVDAERERAYTGVGGTPTGAPSTVDPARAAAFFARPGAAPGAPPAELDDVPDAWVRATADPAAAAPAAAPVVPAWGPDLGSALPGSPAPSAAEVAAFAGSSPRRRGGGRPAPVGPTASPGETFVDLLTNRPAGDAPLFAENRESPLDRALGRNADSMALEQRRAEIEAAGYADTRDALAGAEAARAENEANRRAAMADARNRYRSALDRASAMRVDPEGWFHDRGVGGTIGAAIAVGLGAIGSGITGGDNAALGIINDSIERDLQAQSANIESAFRAADGEATILDQMSREFSSRDAAIEASRAALLEQAAARVSELMASTNAEEVQINGAAMRDQLMADARAAEAAAMQAEIDQAIATRTAMAEMRSAEAEATRDERRAMGGGGPSYSTPTDNMLSTANRLIDSGVSPEDAAAAVGIDPRLLGGSGRFAEASSGDSAANVAALGRALDTIEALIPGGIRVGGPGTPYAEDDVPGVGMTGSLPDFLVSDEGRDLRVEIDNAIDLLGRIRSGGAISADEFASFRRILRGAGTDRALRAGIERIRAEIDARTNRNREGDTMDADIASWMSAAGLTEVPDAAP